MEEKGRETIQNISRIELTALLYGNIVASLVEC